MVRQCPISFVRRFSASPWRFSPSWWRSPWVGSERPDRRRFRHSFQFAQNRALLRWRARFSALRGESGAGWAAGREMKAAVRRRGQNGVWESGQSALENDFGEGRCPPASVGYGAVGDGGGPSGDEKLPRAHCSGRGAGLYTGGCLRWRWAGPGTPRPRGR